jgi:SRSO17 transposase
VQRQYSGTAGRTENCQIGVFLAYASRRGRAFIDRELYLPASWTDDRARCRQAGIPDEVAFATKHQLATNMLTRALEAGTPFRWVTADEAYGQAKSLRVWLEQRDVFHVLATRRTDTVITLGLREERIDEVVAALPVQAWRRRSCGAGAHGRRVYAWARVPIRPWRAAGRGHWVLARRSLADPADIAYYVCYGPARTTLDELLRVAGSRWAIEECFQAAKNETGLDHYQVRTYAGWYRHVTLSMLAHAYLAATAAQAKGDAPAPAATPPQNIMISSH